MEKSGPRKVVRAPALRRGREIIPISDRVKLEKVLGLTVSNNSAFVCDPNSGIVAYPAGCVIVIYNVRKNKQSHILSSSKKTITSLAFSADGKYLATGECGHQPHVRVWDVQEKTQVAEFQGHKYGINCVAFSPNFKYVVSVGSQHDMIVNVWDWKNNVKVASNKVSSKVKALSFASNGNYFVTVGNRHVKFWYLEYSRSAKYKHDPVPLMGRSAILGDQRNNNFCDVACGKGQMLESTYAITKSGLLCEFNSRRLLDKWVELRTSTANSISVSESLIVIGCGDGIIRCFSPYDLNFIATLPRPHSLGVDVAKGHVGSKCTSNHASDSKYADTIAIALDEVNRKVSCVYNDHSFYIWDIKDMKKIGKSHSSMYHSACIWGVEVYPEQNENVKIILPKGTFLTCSSDDTVRFWNLESVMEQDTLYHRNIYSSELLKILYVDPELTYLCDTELNSSGSNDKVDTTYDGKNGVRCLRISPDGKNLASGDRSGNIRIHDLEFIEELYKVEAHDSEVLCLEYSKAIIVAGQEKRYLASASRDRLIHVFDVKQDYAFQQTLDDHSSSITAVRFVQGEDSLQMISCGADKSIIFRKSVFNPQLSLVREHHVVGKTTLYDMEVDAQQKHILTACQDRNIRVYTVGSGKPTRLFRGSQGEDGTLIKVVLDSSGTYLATSCTDKSLYLYDYGTGECLATMFGHSELVTGLKFTSDARHLISVSGDGCIFIWRLPTDVTQNMLNKQMLMEGAELPSLWQDRRKNGVGVTKPMQVIDSNGGDKTPDELDIVDQINAEAQHEPVGFRFSIGQLPAWAKKEMLEKQPNNDNSQTIAPPIPPRGRWAQRIDGQGLVMRSYLESDVVIPFPNVSESDENSNTKVPNGISEDKDYTTCDSNSNFVVSEKSMGEIMNGSNRNHNESMILRRSNNLRVFQNRKTELRPVPSTNDEKLDEMDAEDERSDSEISEMIYYPASEDGSDIIDMSFHVCGNGENNLKENNHIQKPVFERIPSLNVPDNHEMNSDEEDASTPIDSERSFLSSLCISTENLERLGQREKFMKSNYESLDKGESVESTLVNDAADRNFYRQSISAKFLSGSMAPIRRNLNGISRTSPQPERQLSTPSKKREELLKALSDAKQTLKYVGHRSGLSSSKSVADLHSTPDREIFKIPRSVSSDKDIRRTASLSNLYFGAVNEVDQFSPIARSEEESQSKAPLWNQTKMYPEDTPPTTPPGEQTLDNNNEFKVNGHAKYFNKSPGLYKMSSASDLNSQAGQLRQDYFHLSHSSGDGSKPNLPKLDAKRQMVNVAPLVTDSSSDSSPAESTPSKRGFATPVRPVAIRNRNLSLSDSLSDLKVSNQNAELLQKLRLKSRSEWDLKSSTLDNNSNRDSFQSSRYLSYSPRKSCVRPLKLSNSGILHSTALSGFNNESRRESNYEPVSLLSCDPANVPLTPDLCENVAGSLARLSSFAIQIFNRVTLSQNLTLHEKTSMSNTLSQGLYQAQQILRPANPAPSPWFGSTESLFDPNIRKLPQLQDFSHMNGNETQPDAINNILQQFSAKLLSIVEEKMSNSHEKPNS